MTRNHNLYLNICILHTDVYSQHHFINFHFQKTTKLVKMFKKIRSVSKIKKKTDKKVNITPCIENWPKKFYRIFDPTFGIFFVCSKLFSKLFEYRYQNYLRLKVQSYSHHTRPVMIFWSMTLKKIIHLRNAIHLTISRQWHKWADKVHESSQKYCLD